jgi:hypothetical protein
MGCERTRISPHNRRSRLLPPPSETLRGEFTRNVSIQPTGLDTSRGYRCGRTMTKQRTAPPSSAAGRRALRAPAALLRWRCAGTRPLLRPPPPPRRRQRGRLAAVPRRRPRGPRCDQATCPCPEWRSPAEAAPAPAPSWPEGREAKVDGDGRRPRRRQGDRRPGLLRKIKVERLRPGPPRAARVLSGGRRREQQADDLRPLLRAPRPPQGRVRRHNAEYMLQIDATGDGVVLKDARRASSTRGRPSTSSSRPGQFKVPVRYEVLQSSGDREMPERSRFIRPVLPQRARPRRAPEREPRLVSASRAPSSTAPSSRTPSTPTRTRTAGRTSSAASAATSTASCSASRLVRQGDDTTSAKPARSLAWTPMATARSRATRSP